MQLVAEDGVRLKASRWGTGERGTVLLLPDWLASGESFLGIVPWVAEWGWAAVAVDPRGTGHSDRPERGYRLERDAADAALAARQMATPPVVVLGTGYGGLVALMLARESPDLVSLVLVMSPPVVMPGEGPGRSALAAAIEDPRRLWDLVASGASQSLSPYVLQGVCQDMARTTAPAGLAQLNALARAPWESLAGQVSCSVKVATGESDFWSGARHVRARLGMEPTVWRGVGHFPLAEAPRAVAEWMRECAEPAPEVAEALALPVWGADAPAGNAAIDDPAGELAEGGSRPWNSPRW